MANPEIIQIINTSTGGVVSPGQTRVARKGAVVFTIDSGMATVFLPNTGDFKIDPAARTASEGGAKTTATGRGMGIQLRVTPKEPAKITRKDQRASVDAIPFSVYIDGAQTFAMPVSPSFFTASLMNQVTSPVMILDPP